MGQGLSLFGSMMLRFAMSMWVLDETGSATVFASVLAAAIVPTILISPFGGVLADRVNRRTIMVALDASSGLLVLAAASWFAVQDGGFSIIAVGALMVSLSVLSAFETPTVQAALPQLLRGSGEGRDSPRYGRHQPGAATVPRCCRASSAAPCTGSSASVRCWASPSPASSARPPSNASSASNRRRRTNPVDRFRRRWTTHTPTAPHLNRTARRRRPPAPLAAGSPTSRPRYGS